MNELQLQDSLFWLLLQATALTKPGVIQISEAYGLTPPQMFTLCSLKTSQAVPMHSLSTALHCDASNVTGIVDRLVAGGYIERKESPKDRRVKTIELTEKGVRIRQELLQKMAAWQLLQAARLSSAEQAALKKLLTKLLNLDDK